MSQSDTDFKENLDSSIALLDNKIETLTRDYNFDSQVDLANRVLGAPSAVAQKTVEAPNNPPQASGNSYEKYFSK